MNRVLNNIFSQDFFNLFYNSNSFKLEEFYLNNQYYCTLVSINDEYIDDDFNFEMKIGNIRIKTLVGRKWNYISKTDKNSFSIEKFKNLFEGKINNNYNVKKINPANSGEWPLFYLSKNLGVGANVIIAYQNIYKDILERNDEKASFSKELVHDLKALLNEKGVDLEKLYFLKKALVIIIPYSNASILSWRVFEKEKGWEALRCKLQFKRFLHPFPEYNLKCKLFDKDDNTFYENEVKITNEDELVFDFIPQKQSSIEIHKVELKLYENGLLIDDHSGYPIRKLKIKFDIMPEGKNE